MIGGKATQMQVFINTLRECLGKDPLYDPGDSRLTEEQRFYVPAQRWPTSILGEAARGLAANDSPSWLRHQAADRAELRGSGTGRR